MHWESVGIIFIRSNDLVINEIKGYIVEYGPLIKIARRKMQWFGHVSRIPRTMGHIIMHGSFRGLRGRGRPRKNWITDGKRMYQRQSTEDRNGRKEVKKVPTTWCYGNELT